MLEASLGNLYITIHIAYSHDMIFLANQTTLNTELYVGLLMDY